VTALIPAVLLILVKTDSTIRRRTRISSKRRGGRVSPRIRDLIKRENE